LPQCCESAGEVRMQVLTSESLRTPARSLAHGNAPTSCLTYPRTIANLHIHQHFSTSYNSNMRSMNMPAYAQQPPPPNSAAARQTPRLQNTQKPGLGNGTGWGFGLPNNSAGGAAPGGFAGAAAAGAALGAAPGLGPRPTQLSGFAQVMGGGGAQAPIDMR
jgi:hypothetical protein